MFKLAHITDWHATTLEGASFGELANKRVFGWQSWLRTRRRRHRPEVLTALFNDLRVQSPDHVIVTGDLTNIALEQEFAEAAKQLRELGDPSWVTVIPGNHDAYIQLDNAVSWDYWAAYMNGDGTDPQTTTAPRFDEFPTLRVREGVAVIGVCSALATPLFMASGEVGALQLERIEAMLRETGDRGLFRVLAIHHPPTDEEVPPRRRLRDWAELQAVLKRVGAELLVHGHRHRTWLGEVDGPGQAIPVAGARSASDIGVKEVKRAQYHLYTLEHGKPVQLEVRGYDPGTGRVDQNSFRTLG